MSFDLGHAHVMMVKSAGGKPATTHSLSGELYKSKSGWLLLRVPNALVHGAFAALDEPGVELPPSGPDSKLNAHISVIRPEELEEAGLDPDDIKERGHHFKYTLGPIQEVTPHGWTEMSKVWFIKVSSPELKQLRRSYGLTPLPKNNEFDFHISIAVRRKHVLGTNSVSKAASLIHGGDISVYFNRSGDDLRGRQAGLSGVQGERALLGAEREDHVPGSGSWGNSKHAVDQGDRGLGAEAPQAGEDDSVLSVLQQAKAKSDIGDYGTKYMLLRQMMQQHPENFIVDSAEGKYHGITHAPTGFQFHVPQHVYDSLIPRKRAVIIKGNPKFITGNPKADAFYRQLREHLEGMDYDVSEDAGEPHTAPPAANLWIGHSRGADRLRFAPKGVRTLSLGAPGGVNHPDDTAMNPGDMPGDAHYELTPEMLEKISSVAEKAASLGYAVRDSDIHGKGTFATRDYEPGDRIGLALQFNREHEDGTKEYDRTVLGRFVNYQPEGNCTLQEEDGQLYLHATEPIAEDQEIVTKPYEDELAPFEPLQINEGYKQAFDMSGSWYGGAAQDYANNLLAGRDQLWDTGQSVLSNVGRHFGNIRDMASNRINQAENYGRFQAAMDPNYSLRQLSSYLSGQRQPLIKHPIDAILHGRFGS